jgi:hypothetical protein
VTITITSVAAAPEGTAPSAARLLDALDSELAQLYVARLKHCKASGSPFLTTLREDQELRRILAEFRRRYEAHESARSLYRRRHFPRASV